MQHLKIEKGSLNNGLAHHRGVAIPHHMPSPGQDGYRTPNIHDYESIGAEISAVQEVKSSGEEKNVVNNPPSVRILGKHSPKLDLTLEALHWRERIRHFTWTFFTITMATGGIANVLSTGE